MLTIAQAYSQSIKGKVGLLLGCLGIVAGKSAQAFELLSLA